MNTGRICILISTVTYLLLEMNSNKSYWYIFKIFEMNIYLIFSMKMSPETVHLINKEIQETT